MNPSLRVGASREIRSSARNRAEPARRTSAGNFSAQQAISRSVWTGPGLSLPPFACTGTINCRPDPVDADGDLVDLGLPGLFHRCAQTAPHRASGDPGENIDRPVGADLSQQGRLIRKGAGGDDLGYGVRNLDRNEVGVRRDPADFGQSERVAGTPGTLDDPFAVDRPGRCDAGGQRRAVANGSGDVAEIFRQFDPIFSGLRDTKVVSPGRRCIAPAYVGRSLASAQRPERSTTGALASERPTANSAAAPAPALRGEKELPLRPGCGGRKTSARSGPDTGWRRASPFLLQAYCSGCWARASISACLRLRAPLLRSRRPIGIAMPQ